MADLPVSALPVAAAAGAADLLYLVQGGASKQITAGTLFATPPAIGGTSPAAGAFTTLSATGAIKSTGANLLNEASAIKLSQEGVALSRLSAYGNNASTQGVFTVRTVSSDGTASATPVSISSTGLAVTGALSATNNISITGASSILQVLAGAAIQIQNAAASANWNFSTSGTGLTLDSPQLGTFSISNPVAITGTLSTTGVATFPAGTVALPSITTSGDTNTGVYFPAADSVGITTGGTERIRVSSSGLVGIGTVTPLQRLHVVGTIGVNTGVAPGGNGSGIAIFASDFPRLTLRNTTTGDLDTDGFQMYMVGNDAIHNLLESGYQAFFTSAVERMRIDSSGNVLVGKTSATANGGDLQVSTGITFPATQVAASDANTLDDYEEGTWTPTVTPGSGGSFTTITTSGTYTKIGRQVSLMLYINVGSVGTALGGFDITGAPFVPNGTHTYIYGTGANQNTAVAVIFQVYTPGPNFSIGPGTGSTLCATGTKVGAQITYFV